ncbi:nucleotidyltransferase family protein [Vagococcus vulneris]|uniref:Nucleotidyltransferase family protein n=1 Tax=Vagococcus vulneris TaxID=1977869 RepID=A0A430A223_9ENTE|nr:nucleotidyltransferase family protein [Vagococcus vulneris]RSU00509.1 hypothetical protein CBF37_00405 [Vagococcus vulneris]
MKTRLDIINYVRDNRELMEIIHIIENLDLEDCWLCAGAVRNVIWNYLSDKVPKFHFSSDVDIIFFEEEINHQKVRQIETNLNRIYPKYNWEVRNQKEMHLLNPNTVPYKNSCDAVSKFPETCTSIAIRLNKDGDVELFAPYGIEDLVNFRICATPYYSENKKRRQLYNSRIRSKNWQEYWQQLEIHFQDE